MRRRRAVAAAAVISPLMSSTANSAPARAIARAIAKPIVPAPPVTTAIWPASGFSTVCPSFACSSDQYRDRTYRLRRPARSGRWLRHRLSSRLSTPRYRRRCVRPECCRRVRIIPIPAPRSPAASDRARVSLLPGVHCGARNRHGIRPRIDRQQRAQRFGNRQVVPAQGTARSAGNFWYATCDRG